MNLSLWILAWWCFSAVYAEGELTGVNIKDGYYDIFSQALAADNTVISLFSTEKGTIELWVKLNSRPGKDGSAILFFGDRAYNNSITMFTENKYRGLFARISAADWGGQVSFDSPPLELNKWYHIALQWQTGGNKLEINKTKLFINGQAMPDSRRSAANNKSVTPGFLGGGLNDTAGHYFMLGGGNNNAGELNRKLLPDMEFSQLKISSEPLYDKDFTPSKNLAEDEKTLLLVNNDQGKLTARHKKQPGNEVINVEIKLEKF